PRQRRQPPGARPADLTSRGTLRREPYLAKEEQKGQSREQVEGGAYGEGELVAAMHLQEAAEQGPDATKADPHHNRLRRGQPRALLRLDVLHAERLA